MHGLCQCPKTQLLMLSRQAQCCCRLLPCNTLLSCWLATHGCRQLVKHRQQGVRHCSRPADRPPGKGRAGAAVQQLQGKLCRAEQQLWRLCGCCRCGQRLLRF
jgi:hypothetical protein